MSIVLVMTVIVGSFVALVLLLVVIGAVLPRAHVATTRAMLARSPEDVWRALVDLDAQVRWRKGLRRIERLSPTSFREHGAHGAITYTIELDDPPRRRVTRIADDTLPFGGRWTYQLEPAGAGTEITITEDGFVKHPVFRVFAALAPTATMKRFIAELAAHLSSSPTAG
jgi:hypothetical protein